jgi:hypothetical protein
LPTRQLVGANACVIVFGSGFIILLHKYTKLPQSKYTHAAILHGTACRDGSVIIWMSGAELVIHYLTGFILAPKSFHAKSNIS